MNELIQKLAKESGFSGFEALDERMEKFAKAIVFDMLSELTHDDDLGAARIDTIRRLAQRFGVER